MTNLKKLAKEGELQPLQAWLDEQPKRPDVHEMLWCAMWTESEEVRRFLIELATAKKIAPRKKGWPWNDAHAAAISGDPAYVAKAKKRNADFEAVGVAGTPLTTAIRLRHCDVVRALLAEGVDATKSTKMARISRKITPLHSSMLMTDATPLGVALRVGCTTCVDILLEHAELEPQHLGDAVQGADETLLRRVLESLGDAAPLGPPLFWRVHYPSVLPTLAEHGLDLTKLPDDTGTWGGPIWSWWAYDLRGQTRVDAFRALFETGVRATAEGLGDVIGANMQGIASKEMVDLFLDNGADLSDEMEWKTDGWDDVNDCELRARGSLAQRMMDEHTLELVQYVHSKGAAMAPMRPDPNWRDFEGKKAWLEELGMVEELSAEEFPFVESPSNDEIAKLFATDDGVYGIKLGMTPTELEARFPNYEDRGLTLEFEDEKLVYLYRQYYGLHSEGFETMRDSLQAKLGEPKKKGSKLAWPVAGGWVSLKQNWNDAGELVVVDMQADEPPDDDGSDDYDDDYDEDGDHEDDW